MKARRKKANAASKAPKTAERSAWQTYHSTLARKTRRIGIPKTAPDTEDVPARNNRFTHPGHDAGTGGMFMRGSVDYQINRIFTESGIFRPGTSRHKEKDAAKKELAEQGVAASSEALADATGLHSYTYARDCKDTWHRLGHFARNSLYLKDMAKLDGFHVETFLLRRIHDGISYPSWKKEAAHIGKLENALRELHAKEIETPFLSPGVRLSALDPELRTLAREQLRRGGKAFGHFDNPETVITCLDSVSYPKFALIACVQLEGGARCREACRMREKQLLGLDFDRFTGRTRGQIHLTDTKGGKPRTIQVSTGLYTDLEKTIAFHDGVLHVSMGSYAKAVRQAAAKAGEALGGTHAFRYCFARRRYKELTMGLSGKSGLTHEAAIQQISWEMGHERANITMLYLR